jgi:hypothetical protein
MWTLMRNNVPHLSVKWRRAKGEIFGMTAKKSRIFVQ